MIEDAVTINLALSLIFIMIIFYLDRYERESAVSIALVFFISILATYAFGFLKSKIIGGKEFSPFFMCYIEAGLLEELLKFSLLAFVIYRLKYCNEAFDLVVYAGVIALGFSFFENIAYFIKATESGFHWQLLTNDSTMYNRQLVSIFAMRMTPAHLLFNITAVFFLGRKEKMTVWTLGLAFAVAVFLHGTWNYLSFFEGVWFIPYVFLLTIAAMASLVSLSSKSPYLKRATALESLLESNIYLVKHLASAAHESLVLEKLKKIKNGIPSLRFLRGDEQEQFNHFLKRTFPAPISESLKSDRADAESRLDQVLEAMAGLRFRKFDWSYYTGLVVVLFMAAFLAFLIILFFNSFIFNN